MATDSAVMKLELQLESLKLENNKLRRTLTNVTNNFSTASKKTEEMTACALATARQIASKSNDGSTGDSGTRPYVLVLIDCSSHRFRDELLTNDRAGGRTAAHLLRNDITNKIAAKFPEVARNEYLLVVRLYACLQSASRDAAWKKLVGKHFHALAAFYEGFTISAPLFDFVDTGSPIEVPNKICENFKLHVSNHQCKHIFFAAGGWPAYLSTLQSHLNHARKLTVIGGSGSDDRLRQMGLILGLFTRVFAVRTVEVVVATNTLQNATEAKVNEVNVAKEASGRKTPAPTKSLAETGEETSDRSTTLSLLPQRPLPNKIPINLAKQRLDIQTQLPTSEDLQTYKDCTSIQEFCEDFHLRGQCKNIACRLSHARTLPPGALYVLYHKALGTPCGKGSGCRSVGCTNAHVCQQEQCARTGVKTDGCGLSEAMHKVDPHVAEWVMADSDSGDTGIPAQRKTVSIVETSGVSGAMMSISDDLLIHL